MLAAIGAHVREHGGRGDTTALVTAALDAYVAVLLEDPRGIRIGFVEVVGVSPDMEQHRLGNRREWAQLLQGAAVTAGAARVPAWVYAAFIPSLNEFLMAWWQHSDDRSDPRELVQVLTAVLTTLMRQAVSGAG